MIILSNKWALKQSSCEVCKDFGEVFQVNNV